MCFLKWAELGNSIISAGNSDQTQDALFEKCLIFKKPLEEVLAASLSNRTLPLLLMCRRGLARRHH